MSVRREGNGAAELWRYAIEDLVVARQLLAADEVVPRAVCWHAQQAAEKALKSVLAGRAVAFPRTHNLLALYALLGDECVNVDLRGLAELTAWAVQSRYPGEWCVPEVADATRAILAAETIFIALSTMAEPE